MHPFERVLLLDTLLPLLYHAADTGAQAQRLNRWLARHGEGCGLVPAAVTPAAPETGIAEEMPTSASPRDWKKAAAAVTQLRARARVRQSSRVARNLDLLAALLHLSPADARIFGLLYRMHESAAFRQLYTDDEADNPDQSLTGFLAQALGVERRTTIRALQAGGPLTRAGLLAECGMDTGMHYGNHYVNRHVAEALHGRPRDTAELASLILGAPVTPELEWRDFEHVLPDLDLAAGLLRGACARRQKGINILLYGCSGTGKTQFCRVVARAAGITLHEIASVDADGEQPTAYERLAHLHTSATLTAARNDTVLLFDEMEDLLTSRRNGQGAIVSKAWFNGQLENNSAPVLWTSNSLDTLDEAFLRRMTCVIRLKAPPRAARERIWKRALARQRVHLDDDQVRQLATRHDVSPGFVGNAVMAARLTGNKEVIPRVLAQVAEAFGHPGPGNDAGTAADYDPALVRCELPIDQLTQALTRTASRRFGLCLYGPPGTGKSVYARWLAVRMGMDVQFVRASDLLSKWLGESEQKIAATFRKAAEDETFLIIDEADSLLQDRGRAEQSWQVTQVNEMLTWMEHHPLPFVFTTNLVDGLDRAAMRRFVFKARFDYLAPAQNSHAFRHFLHAEPPAALERLDRLTPGDFRVVQRKAEILGTQNPEQLLAMLREEIAHKTDRTPRPIGFA